MAENLGASSFKRKTTFAMKAGLFDNKSRHVDARPILTKVGDYTPIFMPFSFIGFGGLILFIPALSYLLFLIALVAFLGLLTVQFNYLVDIPVTEKPTGFSNEGKVVTKADAKKKGIQKRAIGRGLSYLLLGYDLLFRRQLWIDVDRETRMILISGTTGSGKTVTLNSMLYQTCIQGHLKHGAPFLLCDGKGSIKGLYEWLFYMIRTGRQHDIRLLNFLTAGKKQNPEAMLDDDYSSNFFNPFSVLNKEESRGLIMSFGKSSEGGNSDFFRDRASTMLGGLFSPLVYKRDVLGEPLDVSVILKFTDLRNMFSIAASSDYPSEVVKPLREYLKSLNGVQDADFNRVIDQNFEVNSKADEQHTYNKSMLSKTLNDMVDTLGHIFCSSGSDINLSHAFMHGQGVFVLLPTIEREPDSMAELGRMVVGSLRPALSPLLGYKVQGFYGETVKSLPSNRIIPIRLYFDEVLNYYVKGISNFLSLLRSSHVSMILMGQSLKGIEDSGLSEGRQSLANLNNMLLFSTQDVYETMELISKKLGKTVANVLSQMNSNEWGGWDQGQQLQMQEEDVINARDMAGAAPMEGLYTYKGDVIPFRSSTMFPDDKRDGELDFFRLNILAELGNPTVDEVDRVRSMLAVNKQQENGTFVRKTESSGRSIIQVFADRLNRNIENAAKIGTQYSDNTLDLFTYALSEQLAIDAEDDFNERREAVSKQADIPSKSTSQQRTTEIIKDNDSESIVLIYEEDEAEAAAVEQEVSDKPVDVDHSTEAVFARSESRVGISKSPLANIKQFNDTIEDNDSADHHGELPSATEQDQGAAPIFDEMPMSAYEDVPPASDPLVDQPDLFASESESIPNESSPKQNENSVEDSESQNATIHQSGELSHLFANVPTERRSGFGRYITDEDRKADTTLSVDSDAEALADQIVETEPSNDSHSEEMDRLDEAADQASVYMDEAAMVDDDDEDESGNATSSESNSSSSASSCVITSSVTTQAIIQEAARIEDLTIDEAKKVLLDPEVYPEKPLPASMTSAEQQEYLEHVGEALSSDIMSSMFGDDMP